LRKFFLVFAVILLALVVGADFAAAAFLESRAKEAVRDEFQLGQEPDVQIRDFPFLLSAVRGHVGEVNVDARNVQAEGVVLSEVGVDLFDAEVPHSIVLDGSGVITVERVSGEVRLAEAEVNRLLQQQAPGVTVRLGAGAVQLSLTRDVLGQQLEISLTGEPSLEGGVARFQPTGLSSTVELPAEVEEAVLGQPYLLAIPPLPAGLSVNRIEAQPGALVLFAEVGPVQFQP
jgi:hypothetical protein